MLRDEATGEPVLSSAPVAAFAGASNSPYMYGSLARLADDNGEATVMLGHIPPPARCATKECANLDAVSTPRAD